MVLYTVRVRVNSAYGEAFLGSKAYKILVVRKEQLTPEMQIINIIQEKSDLNKPRKDLNTSPIERYDKNNPKPIKDRIRNKAYRAGYKEVKIAPHTLAPAPGYKKPFDYKLYNTLRRMGRLKPRTR